MTWIRLSAQEPEKGQRVVVYAPSGDTDQPLIQVAVYRGNMKFTGVFPIWQDSITHWKPLDMEE